jgi:hypothetical protein
MPWSPTPEQAGYVVKKNDSKQAMPRERGGGDSVNPVNETAIWDRMAAQAIAYYNSANLNDAACPRSGAWQCRHRRSGGRLSRARRATFSRRSAESTATKEGGVSTVSSGVAERTPVVVLPRTFGRHRCSSTRVHVVLANWMASPSQVPTMAT